MAQECIYNITIKPGTEDVPYLSFPVLERLPFVRHGVSTRKGGVSTGEFASMNLGFRRGDADENVMENYRRLCRSMDIPVQSLVLTDQVHETNIRKVSSADCGKGIFYPKDYQCVDGLVTDEPEVALVVFGADCVPLFFVDVVRHAIGVAHAGWRGTLADIGGIMVRRMQEEYGSLPSELICAIGPSICGNCYEVSADVAEQFLQKYSWAEYDTQEFLQKHTLAGDAAQQKALRKYIPEEMGIQESLDTVPVRRRTDNPEKFQLDLWETNRRLLLLAGMAKENIVVSGLCTCCHPELLFSHRVMGAKRGSMAGFLMLKENW